MNVNKVYEKFCASFPKLSFKVADSSTANCLTFTGSVTVESCFDDDIFIKGVVYDSGSTHLFLTLDKLEPTLSNLTLLNRLNCETAWVKAYIDRINGNNYLCLHYSAVYSYNEAEAAQFLTFCFNDLLSDNTLKLLQPLTVITE